MNITGTGRRRQPRLYTARPRAALRDGCGNARLTGWIVGGSWAKRRRMSDTPPDRLATNPKSPFYDEAVLARGVGVRFKGEEKTNVDEYCVSEGWVRLAVGKTLDRHGNPMTVKLQGTVEPYFRDDASE